MQITAGSILGQFGSAPKRWAERMLDEGMVHILASDAHGVDRRPPGLRKAFEVVAKRIGETKASLLVSTRPAGILRDIAPDELL